MTNSCGCGHCHCDGDEAPTLAGSEVGGPTLADIGQKTPEEKMEDLKKAIAEAGFETKETPEGDIKILEK